MHGSEISVFNNSHTQRDRHTEIVPFLTKRIAKLRKRCTGKSTPDPAVLLEDTSSPKF
jgi:hypothetical protein